MKAANKSALGSPISDVKDLNENLNKGAEGKPPSICSRLMGGCVQKMPCCAKLAFSKQPSTSQVQLVNEKPEKKKKFSKDTEASKASGGGKLSKLNCFKKKDDTDSEMVNITSSKAELGNERGGGDKTEETPSPGCLSCCKRKNKIRDSSADRRNVNAERWWHKIACCKTKKQKQQDWAARRDSILSTPAPPPGYVSQN